MFDSNPCNRIHIFLFYEGIKIMTKFYSIVFVHVSLKIIRVSNNCIVIFIWYVISRENLFQLGVRMTWFLREIEVELK